MSHIPQIELDQIDHVLEQMESLQTIPDDGRKSIPDIQPENLQDISDNAKKPPSANQSGCSILCVIDSDEKLQQQSLDHQDSMETDMPNLKRLKELLLKSQEVLENAERLVAGYKPALMITCGRHDSGDTFVPEIEKNYGDSKNSPYQNRPIILSGLLAGESPPGIGTSIANSVNDESDNDVEEDDENGKDMVNKAETASKWKGELAAAHIRFEFEHEESSQEVTVVPQVFGLRTCIQEPLTGRNATDMSNDNVEGHTISPIPMSCGAVLAQTCQESLSTPAKMVSITPKESRDHEFFQRVEALDNKIEQWLNRKKSYDQVGRDIVSSPKGKGRALGVFEDYESFWLPESSCNDDIASKGAIEHDDPFWHPGSSSSTAIAPKNAFEDTDTFWLPESSSSIGIVSMDALEDLSDLRRPGYLQHNSFFLEANATKEEVNNISLKEELLDELERCPMYLSRNPNMARVWPEKLVVTEPSSIPHLVSARLELGDVTLGNWSSPTSPVSSGVFEDADEILSADQSSFTAEQVFTLTRLEENVAPKPSSMIQTSIDAGWKYDSGVVIEDEEPHHLHSTPFPAFNMFGVIAYLGTILKRWWGPGAVVPSRSSVTVEGELVERPRNPSPRRAQRQ